MSVLSVSSLRPPAEADIEEITRVAVGISGQLALASVDQIRQVIVDALARVAAATHVGDCQLLEFGQSGSVEQTFVIPGRAGDDRRRAPEGRLVSQLLRGEVASVSRPENRLPYLVAVDGEPGSLLGVPASMGGRVVCALVVDAGRESRRWPRSLVARLQLIVEILAAALQRHRSETVLRANVAQIEDLNARLQADNVYLKEEIKSYHDFDDIVGESQSLVTALARVSQVAPTSSTVLLQGQTGTGKELFARALHERSRRHARPLVRVNCAALPPTLVESELFGHEKGAFTGAVATRQGRFELADGGTIFLDEIGDLPQDIQVKFLRVLQEGEFERVGSSRTKRVDVRVIAATHHDLEKAVAEGRFRADLYYRLSVYPIHLPSLRERADDIPRLVWFFINRHQRNLCRNITKVPQTLMESLQRHTWPGNVRELENVVERAMIASSGETLQLDAPLAFSNGGFTPLAAGSDNLDDVQRAHIENVLKKCGGRINGTKNAAERLGIHPNTLRFRMKKLGVSTAARGLR
jgi:transcriptional regulator with GAF, ATPase, and Fis domain